MAGLNVNTIADEAGTGGPDFVAMPSVGGSPIVESGSNSDGEWTRWADGTQITHKYDFDKTTNPHTYTYPMSFISAPAVHPSVRSNAAFFATVANETTTQADLFVWSDSGVGNSAVNLSITVSGRWK